MVSSNSIFPFRKSQNGVSNPSHHRFHYAQEFRFANLCPNRRWIKRIRRRESFRNRRRKSKPSWKKYASDESRRTRNARSEKRELRQRNSERREKNKRMSSSGTHSQVCEHQATSIHFWRARMHDVMHAFLDTHDDLLCEIHALFVATYAACRVSACVCGFVEGKRRKPRTHDGFLTFLLNHFLMCNRFFCVLKHRRTIVYVRYRTAVSAC